MDNTVLTGLTAQQRASSTLMTTLRNLRSLKV